MEGLAAGASVAGVLSLAGQTLEGIIKLYGFFKDVKEAPRTAQQFLIDINLLIKTIEDVRSLLSPVAEALPTAGRDLKVIALEIQLQDCSKDVYEWLKIAEKHHPEFSTGTKASFKKFWVALTKREIFGLGGIEERIKNHRHIIVDSLAVLGRALDVSNAKSLAIINDKLVRASEDAAAIHEESMSQLSKIDGVRRASVTSLKHCRSSKSSLQRIERSLSRLETAVARSQEALISSPSFRRRSSSSIAHSGSASRLYSNFSSLECLEEHPHTNFHAPRLFFGKNTFTLGGSSDGESCHFGTSSNEGLFQAAKTLFPDSKGRERDIVTEKTDDVYTTDDDVGVDDNAVDSGNDSSDWEDGSAFSSEKKNPIPNNEKKLIPELLPYLVDERMMTSKKSPDVHFRANSLPTILMGGGLRPVLASHPGLTPDSRLIFEKQPGKSQLFAKPDGEDDDSSTSSSLCKKISKALRQGPTMYSRNLKSYIMKVRLATTIKQEIAIISRHATGEILDSYLKPLDALLLQLEPKIDKARKDCLAAGHAIHHVDDVLTSCFLHDPETGLRLPKYNTSAHHTDILALRRKALKAKAKVKATLETTQYLDSELELNQIWDTKLDRINAWLFNNLQSSSDNAALHRSLLPDGGASLDDKTWARSVIKFWSIDEAVLGEEFSSRGDSSRGAVGSWGEDETEQARARAARLRKPMEWGLRIPKVIRDVKAGPAMPTVGTTVEHTEGFMVARTANKPGAPADGVLRHATAVMDAAEHRRGLAMS